MISDAVIEFLAIGRSVSVGSCDAHRQPHATRCAAVRFAADRKHATVFIAEQLARPLLANIQQNPRIALQVSHPLDHRTVQFKGLVAAAGPASPEDRGYIEQYLSELAAVVDQIGMPHDRVMCMARWPAVACSVVVTEVYLQTPGPGAGSLLGGRRP